MTYTAAVVGCGRMGAFTSPAVRAQAPACWFPLAHAEAIAAHPRLRLVAVADSDREAAERAARHHGAGTAFADGHALLASVRPDLVAIATRTPGRAALILDAIRHGARALHVEKPLCNSMQELVQISDALGSAETRLTLGAIRRRLPPFQAALTLAHSGKLGRLLEVQVNLGAAPLFWTHPHAVDMLLAAADGAPVADVTARLVRVDRGGCRTHITNDPQIETATIRFANGLVGRMGRMAGSDLLLGCENGSIAVEADGHRTRILRTDDGEAYASWRDADMSPPGGPGGTLSAISELVSALDGDTTAIAANARWTADILLGQRLLFAIAQSDADGGRPVSPDAVDPGWVIDGLSGGRPA